jgi:hypothetical protein
MLIQDLNTIISTWGLLLGLFGGIAVILFVYNMENRPVESWHTLHSLLLTSGIVLLILAPVIAIWLVRDIFRDQTTFFICIGIMFGLIISLLAYLAVKSYSRYQALPPEERRNFRNKTVFTTWVCAINVFAMFVWLGLFFWLVVCVT